MAERAGAPWLSPKLIRDAVSPGLGVLVCRIRTKSATLGVDDVTGAGVRDGVIKDSEGIKSIGCYFIKLLTY
jgi:hypothetical protein